jgi:hypothetical protein
VSVYVTYVDDGDLRIVIETEEPYFSEPGGWSSTSIDVAYIALPLWNEYVARVSADIEPGRARRRAGKEYYQTLRSNMDLPIDRRRHDERAGVDPLGRYADPRQRHAFRGRDRGPYRTRRRAFRLPVD